jgi:drug/metabolite transporter (DMT)-like permease
MTPRSARIGAAYAACSLIWGTTWYAIRVCIEDYPTMAALALRFGIAVVILVPIAIRMRPWPRAGKSWAYLALAGTLDAGAYMLVYLGEERVSGGIAAVLYGTQPLILAGLLAITRMERTTGRHLIGAGVALCGVAVLFLDRLDVSARQAAGVAMVIASVVVATSYSMVMKRHGEGIHRVVSTTVFLAVTAFVLGIAAAVAHAAGVERAIPWPPPRDATLALMYLAVVGSVVAFLVYFWLLAKTSLLVTSTLVFTYPLVAIVTDALFEEDIPMTGRVYLGAAVILAGLAVSLRRKK